MNKKVFPLLFVSILLTSCRGNDVLQYVSYSYDKQEITFPDLDESNYYRKKDFTPIVTKQGDFINMREFLVHSKDNRTHKLMKTTGVRKMLVLPIRFTDSPNDISIEDKTIYIKNAFFGDSSVTKLESVASFYDKSSYGKLKIKGEVAPWFNLNISSREWNKKGSNQTEASRRITLEVLSNYIDNGGDINQYDSDLDGYIDSLFVIYDYPYSNSGNNKSSSDELFWAYVDFIKENEAGLNNAAPYANAYGWASLYFALENSVKSNASTFIHETGHILGLQDYYNTGSRNLGYHYQPLGFFDLMDSNQGDHSVLSKYLLNWTTPKVLKKDQLGDITLTDFSSTGDYLLIPLNEKYNDNPYAEYLLLEYFSPTGLNTPNGLVYQDEDKTGETVNFSFPDVHGLKVFHVDARLAYFEKKVVGTATTIKAFVGEEEGIDVSNTIISFAYTNEIKDNDIYKHNVFYHLLEKSGENTFKDGHLASDDTLWGYGDTFGINTFTVLAEKAGVSFKINALNRNSVTINFAKF